MSKDFEYECLLNPTEQFDLYATLYPDEDNMPDKSVFLCFDRELGSDPDEDVPDTSTWELWQCDCDIMESDRTVTFARRLIMPSEMDDDFRGIAEVHMREERIYRAAYMEEEEVDRRIKQRKEDNDL